MCDPRRVGSMGAALALVASIAASSEPPRLRAAIRTAGDGSDRALLERIRGQASDLPVSIVERATEPLEATLAARIARADLIGREERARAVVWFENALGARGSTLTVSVSDLESGRLLRRALPIAGGDGALGSAMLEAAALLVRTALQSIALGEPIGLSRDAAIATKPPPPPASLESPAPAASNAGTVWSLRLGFALTADGVSRSGGKSIVAAFERDDGSLAAAISVELGLVSPLADDLAEIDFSRHAAALSFGVRTGGALRLKVGARAGAALVVRRTVSTAEGVLASPGRSAVGALFGPELELQWAPAGAVVIAIGSSLDVLPSAPTFAYDDGGVIVPAHRAWLLEPRLVASVGAVL